METKVQTLSKLEMNHLVGGNVPETSVQTEHSHQTKDLSYYLSGNYDVEVCGDAYADNCC
ncbi:MAG TPA: hypothetical protein VGD40_21145 [Chryseosolibacter sp.]